METHKLPPEMVVQMLKDSGIQKVKLFDAEKSTMSALAGSGLEVMITQTNTDDQESHGETENLSAICTLQSKSKSKS
ncbi:hypothetical protein ACFX13_033886 [Malus domestica]